MMTGLIVVGYLAVFLIGIAVGFLWYGWIIASSLTRGRLPKSLENLGFTLPDEFKKDGEEAGDDEQETKPSAG